MEPLETPDFSAVYPALVAGVEMTDTLDAAFYAVIKFDTPVKSRHSGEGRNSDVLQRLENTGSRPSPE